MMNFFRIFLPIDMYKLCSELQTASEFLARSENYAAYKMRENFYNLDIRNFALTTINITRSLPQNSSRVYKKIQARNCHLKNSITNASIFVTALPVDITVASNEKKEFVVAECYPNDCVAMRMFQIQLHHLRYPINAKEFPVTGNNQQNISTTDLGEFLLSLLFFLLFVIRSLFFI